MPPRELGVAVVAVTLAACGGQVASNDAGESGGTGAQVVESSGGTGAGLVEPTGGTAGSAAGETGGSVAVGGTGGSRACSIDAPCDPPFGRCGDGALFVEQCDDGNGIAGDGCSDRCRLEPGFICPIAGARCEPLEPGAGGDSGGTCVSSERSYAGLHGSVGGTCIDTYCVEGAYSQLYSDCRSGSPCPALAEDRPRNTFQDLAGTPCGLEGRQCEQSTWQTDCWSEPYRPDMPCALIAQTWIFGCSGGQWILLLSETLET
jgi:cysteine-rich repeat protein